MNNAKIGFIGLGNVGEKLAKNLCNNKKKLIIFDKNNRTYLKFKKYNTYNCKTLKELSEKCNVVITCLPSPSAVSNVITKLMPHINKSHIWIEMSTTDYKEMIRLSKIFKKKGGEVLESPITGGEHRAKSGNISILVAGKKSVFKNSMPILSKMGHNILYCGKVGNASLLKVITNYLASLHLLGIGEALALAKMNKLDLDLAYKAIKISSGNSFVNETETQVILGGSYDVGFTMDLVNKDLSLFNNLAKNKEISLDLAKLTNKKFREGLKKLGKRSFSTSVVKLIEKKFNIKMRAKNYPKKLIDFQPKQKAVEVK